MFKIWSGLVILAMSLGSSAAIAKGAHKVAGHVKKNGTYVAPHRQTNPDKTKQNNWSSKGNSNPDTGKQGTKDASK